MTRSTHSRAIVAMSLGGLLFGFDTAVISGVTEALRDEYALSAAGLGAAVSAALWGTLAGAMFSGAPGDRWGSLAVLRVIRLLYVVSAIGCAVADSLIVFSAFRFLGGIAIGASSVLVPVYIAEVSPSARRGFLVGLFQFNIVFGILVAYLSNFLIAQAVDPVIAWRWKLAAAALPAALFLILLTVAIGLFNHLSGINAILYYLNDIVAAAGFVGLSADAQAMAIGVANLIATMTAMVIIDRVGRRPLLILGGLVTALALAGVALVYAGAASATLLLPLLMLFIVAFAMSQGTVIWVYLSEIFPTDVRARGQSIGNATHWVANAVLSFAFPMLAERSHSLPFWFFAAAMLLQSLLVWRFFPETRGRALKTISADLSARHRHPLNQQND